MTLTLNVSMECERDSDCSNEGFLYCLLNKCTECVNCEGLLNRFSLSTEKGQILCAKTESECGGCLTGYQTKDYVSQQLFAECFLTPLAESNSSNMLMTSVILLTMAAFIGVTIYVNRRRVVVTKTDRAEEENLFKDLPLETPRIGVNCALIGTCVGNFISVAVEQEYLNKAVPIGDYHRPRPLLPTAIIESQGGDESTVMFFTFSETRSDMNLQSQPLIRSRSLELARPNSNTILRPSTSDSTLPTRRLRGESYSHLHVLLSMHRLVNTQATTTDDSTNEPLLSGNIGGESIPTLTSATNEETSGESIELPTLRYNVTRLRSASESALSLKTRTSQTNAQEGLSLSMNSLPNALDNSEGFDSTRNTSSYSSCSKLDKVPNLAVDSSFELTVRYLSHLLLTNNGNQNIPSSIPITSSPPGEYQDSGFSVSRDSINEEIDLVSAEEIQEDSIIESN